MLGSFDSLFDFDRNGELGAFEKAAQMEFLEGNGDSWDDDSYEKAEEDTWIRDNFARKQDESWERDDWATR